MGAARGIAAILDPEQAGHFVALDELEADWFIRRNNTGGLGDVWRVENIDQSNLFRSPEGHLYFLGLIDRDSIRLERRDPVTARPVRALESALHRVSRCGPLGGQVAGAGLVGRRLEAARLADGLRQSTEPC